MIAVSRVIGATVGLYVGGLTTAARVGGGVPHQLLARLQRNADAVQEGRESSPQ